VPRASAKAPRSTVKYLGRSTSGVAGIDLGTTIKYLRGAASIVLGTTFKYLRRATKAAGGGDLGTTAKCLVNQNEGAGNKWIMAHNTNAGPNSAETPCIAEAF
jgi:hypothetical protein